MAYKKLKRTVVLLISIQLAQIWNERQIYLYLEKMKEEQVQIEQPQQRADFELVERYSYESLIQNQLWRQAHKHDLTAEDKEKLNSLSSALKQCFYLAQDVQNRPFGYFFSEPVNPFVQRLPDYWRIIRKPIDLTTIKRKFFIGMYMNHSQFNSDMKRMFSNSLTYNKNKPILVKKTKELYHFYQVRYQILINKIEQGWLSVEILKKKVGQETIANRLDAEQLSLILNQDRKRQLGKLLEFLLPRNKLSILNMLKKKYPDLVVHQKEGQAVLLNQLTPHQIYDLLKLAKSVKPTDFDTAKLMNVPIDPLLEGYEDFREPVSMPQSREESDFEIEDESEENEEK